MDGVAISIGVTDSDDGSRLRFLTRCDAFRSVPVEHLRGVAQNARIVDVDRRRTLFRQDGSARALYVVGSGRVRVSRRTADGRSLTLYYANPGETVGEDAVVLDRHSADAVAAEDASGLAIPMEVVRDLLAAEPAFGRSLLERVLLRRQSAERRLEAVLTRPVESRVASFIVEIASRHGIDDPRGVLVSAKFTHQEIASWVGSTRETVTLVLGDLKRRGLIDIDHRRVVVVDNDGLTSLQ